MLFLNLEELQQGAGCAFFSRSPQSGCEGDEGGGKADESRREGHNFRPPRPSHLFLLKLVLMG